MPDPETMLIVISSAASRRICARALTRKSRVQISASKRHARKCGKRVDPQREAAFNPPINSRLVFPLPAPSPASAEPPVLGQS